MEADEIAAADELAFANLQRLAQSVCAKCEGDGFTNVHWEIEAPELQLRDGRTSITVEAASVCRCVVETAVGSLRHQARRRC